MAGRDRDNDLAFRDTRRDWINDRATRQDDRDGGVRGPMRSRSRDRDDPFISRGQGDWRNKNSRSPNRGRMERMSPEVERGRFVAVAADVDTRKNPFPSSRERDTRFGRDGDFIGKGRSPSIDRDRTARDRGIDSRSRGSRSRSPSRPAPFGNDRRGFRGRRSRERSVDKPDKPWSGRDRFQRDRRIPDRNSRENSLQNDRTYEGSKSPRNQSPASEKFVDNWGRELRLGGAARSSSKNSRPSPPRKRSMERGRRDVSEERTRTRRSRERDWKTSVDSFLGARGSRGSSPNWRGRSRDSPGRDSLRRGDKTEEEWDREIQRFEKERTRPSRRLDNDRDRQSPARDRRSPFRGRRTPVRDRRSPIRDRRSPLRDRPSPPRRRSISRRSRSRDIVHRGRSQDRSRQSRPHELSKRSRSRDLGQRKRDLDRSPQQKSRDRTPVVDENMDGEDMVISDDDNNEEPTKVSADDWETQNILKYSKNNENLMISSYKTSIPQKTVVIRCMPVDATEIDIHLDITSCNLVCHDIRLVRRKDTGSSRGFAFVEFYNVDDAVTWMELRQGTLMLHKTRCLMEYSTPRDTAPCANQPKYINDWICSKCQAHNFSKRFLCFVCSAARTYRDDGGDLHPSDHPTSTVVLIGLDVLTSEETVLKSIASLSNLPIRSVKIARDPITNISKGGCYLEMNNVVDAFNLYNTLKASVPEIDGKLPEVKYARLDVNKVVSQAVSILPKSATGSGKIGNAAIAAAQWSHQVAGLMNQGQYTLADVPKLAEYSAAMYATTPAEKMAYYNYYQAYYKKQIAEGMPIALPQNSAAGLASAQAALAASKSDSNAQAPLDEPPDGSGTAKYPMPDTSVYQYDASSGFYYDPYTKLYYDANSQYYYNGKTGKYLYWDGTRSTYLPAPTSAQLPEMSQTSGGSVIVGAPQPAKAEEKKKEGDSDRVKVAKRIAKDMEKWAKTLNQKKETAKQSTPTSSAPVSAAPAPVSFSVGISGQSKFARETGAADIGFAVLERKDHLSTLGNYYNSVARTALTPAPIHLPPTVDSDEDEESNEDKSHTDWDKLICLLCKRQLGSREALVKHQQMSDLHKQNLAAWYRSRGLDPDDEQKRKIQYRDRASERRQKYGIPDTPKPSRLKETYIKARESVYEQPTTRGIGSDNLGNKLLQKMGWQEGMGLGKTNQGRTSIIEAKARSTTAGLGTRATGVTPGPGETYKDCVKKMMAVRYAQLDER